MKENVFHYLLKPYSATASHKVLSENLRRQRATDVVSSCILRARDNGRTCANCEYFKAVTSRKRKKLVCSFYGEVLDKA